MQSSIQTSNQLSSSSKALSNLTLSQIHHENRLRRQLIVEKIPENENSKQSEPTKQNSGWANENIFVY